MSKPSDLPPMVSAPSAAVTISTQLMVAAIIFLFMVVVFIFFLYLYTTYYMGSAHARRRSRARFIFASADQFPAPRRGLDAAALKSLPITVFRQVDFKGAIDCAVCLSELSEGEEARILPKCGHGFHVECVDMWLHSHTTCPLCRAPVTAAAGPPRAEPREGVSANGSWPESLSFPTNVLFWGDHDRMGPGPQEGTSSSRPEGALAIDIPRRAMEAEDMKSPVEEKTPKSARLRSFRRLLSRGKMVVGSSCSPRGGDIEQGLAGGAPGEGSSPTREALVA